MKHQLFQARFVSLFQQRNALVVLTSILLMTNLLQALFNFYRSERVVMIPPEVKQSFWVETNQVSASYLEEMSSFFTHLILDITPVSAGFQHHVLLRYVTPSGYGAIKAQLLAEETVLKKDNVTLSFQPIEIKVDQESMTATVTGDLNRFVGQKHISSSKEIYHLKFKYLKGRLFLESFKQSEENDHAD